MKWIMMLLTLSVLAGYTLTGSATDPDPLEQALSAVHLQTDSFRPVKPEESYYRLVGRFPIIDCVGQNPFLLPEYGRWITDSISASSTISEVVACLQGVIGIKDSDSSGTMKETSAPPSPPPGVSQKTLPEPNAAHGTPGFLSFISSSMEQAVRLQHQAVEQLTGEDKKQLQDDLPRYFMEAGRLRFMTGPTQAQFEILNSARKTDIKKLITAQKILLLAVMEHRNDLEQFARNFTPQDNQIVLDARYPWGRCIVGGTGKNEYHDDAALIIDLGGDDRYYNNAGASTLKNPVSLLLDLAGDDEYLAEEPGRQGFGFLGVGLLCDINGDDRYTARDFSQGGGYLGCGLIWDRQGSDQYNGGQFCQGAGLFGTGALIDENGDDSYTSRQMTQGYGSTLGVGLLYDRTGDDKYHAIAEDYGFAQGSGCGCRSYPWKKDVSMYGGIGILLDDEGMDSYQGSSFVQGASYFLSLGILVDRSGDDYYVANGSYSHGAGVHLTSGFLCDYSGNDHYSGKWGGTAVGNDESIGIFIDLAGDDYYEGSDGDGQSYSHKPYGLSILIDVKGDDVYQASGYSQGYVLPPITPDAWSYAVFLDTNGTDRYSMQHRADNSRWQDSVHAFGMDGTIGEYNPFVSFHPNASPIYRSNEKNNENSTIFKLFIPEPGDPFSQSIQVRNQLQRNLSDLINELGHGTPDYRRATEEAITIKILSEKPNEESLVRLYSGLSTEDPVTRAFSVMTLDVHDVKQDGKKILSFLKDPDPYVRKLIYRAVGNLEVAGGADALVKAIGTDLQKETEPVCRGMALRSIGKFKDPAYTKILLQGLRDESEFVRMMAAYSLGKVGAKDAMAPLQAAARESSPYLKKAAGEALLQLGQRDGLLPMIEYLNYRALDTSSDNYGSNLGSVLMEYTNADLGRDFQKWMEWYQVNGTTFDLSQNLKARESYLAAVKMKESGDTAGAIGSYETALTENPDYLKARTEYAGLLNETAWTLVTTTTDREELKRGLKLAQQCVRLDSQAMYLDTLAEACYRNGLIAEAIQHQEEAVKSAPDEKEYQTRLEMFRRAAEKK